MYNIHQHSSFHTHVLNKSEAVKPTELEKTPTRILFTGYPLQAHIAAKLEHYSCLPTQVAILPEQSN